MKDSYSNFQVLDINKSKIIIRIIHVDLLLHICKNDPFHRNLFKLILKKLSKSIVLKM